LYPGGLDKKLPADRNCLSRVAGLLCTFTQLKEKNEILIMPEYSVRNAHGFGAPFYRWGKFGEFLAGNQVTSQLCNKAVTPPGMRREIRCERLQAGAVEIPAALKTARSFSLALISPPDVRRQLKASSIRVIRGDFRIKSTPIIHSRGYILR
jgi:hypothetical protein